MTPIAAVCPEHGPFEALGLGLSGVKIASFSNTKFDCPVCGFKSPGMEGEYSIDHQGIATVINAPEWSRKALAAVQKTFLQAAEEVATKTSKPADKIAEEARTKAVSQLSQLEDSSSAVAVIEHAYSTEPRNEHVSKRDKVKFLLAALAIAVPAVLASPGAALNAIELYDTIRERIGQGEHPSEVEQDIAPLTDLPPEARNAE